jgi:hypothetical protein
VAVMVVVMPEESAAPLLGVPHTLGERHGDSTTDEQASKALSSFNFVYHWDLYVFETNKESICIIYLFILVFTIVYFVPNKPNL